MSECPVTAARFLRNGRERLLALVDHLAAHAAEGCVRSSRDCRTRTEELLAQLETQAGKC